MDKGSYFLDNFLLILSIAQWLQLVEIHYNKKRLVEVHKKRDEGPPFE